MINIPEKVVALFTFFRRLARSGGPKHKQKNNERQMIIDIVKTVVL